MADFVAWYRREDYQHIRSIMDDGPEMPPTFDEWERTAKGQLTQAAKAGVLIQPVILKPDEFLSYCKAENLPHRGSQERTIFAVASGAAKGWN